MKVTPTMTTAAPKYLLFPGMVKSKFDGNDCYVQAHVLAHMYQVRWEQCRVYPTGDNFREQTERRFLRDALARGELTPLYPDESGVYKRP